MLRTILVFTTIFLGLVVDSTVQAGPLGRALFGPRGAGAGVCGAGGVGMGYEVGVAPGLSYGYYGMGGRYMSYPQVMQASYPAYFYAGAGGSCGGSSVPMYTYAPATYAYQPMQSPVVSRSTGVLATPQIPSKTLPAPKVDYIPGNNQSKSSPSEDGEDRVVKPLIVKRPMLSKATWIPPVSLREVEKRELVDYSSLSDVPEHKVSSLPEVNYESIAQR